MGGHLTGYGTQTALFAPMIGETLGYDVAFSAFYGLQGNRLGWVAPSGESYIVYPGGRDPYGSDVLGAHAKHWFNGDPGLLITLTDPWVLNPTICSRLPVLAWTPVDHDPLMVRTHNWLHASGAAPLAMSRFGERVLEEAGHQPLYVPHGFDPSVFKPGDRVEARELAQLDQDAFVVGIVAANKGFPSRKAFAQSLQAFAIFQEKYAPDAILYVHTLAQPSDGENIPAICESLGIRPEISDQYGYTLGTPATVVAHLMRAFDVLLNPSQGEGFGVPLVEAQACGTPCITTNFSSMPEVAPVAEGNWSVEGQKVWTAFESWQVSPNVEELVECLRQAYEAPTETRLKTRDRVAAWALSEYEASYVTDFFWRQALKESAEKIRWARSKMGQYSVVA